MLTSYSTKNEAQKLKEYNYIKIHLCLWCSVKSLDIIPSISLCLYSQPIRPRQYSLLPQRQSFKLRGGGETWAEVLSQLWRISRAELPELSKRKQESGQESWNYQKATHQSTCPFKAVGALNPRNVHTLENIFDSFLTIESISSRITLRGDDAEEVGILGLLKTCVHFPYKSSF